MLAARTLHGYHCLSVYVLVAVVLAMQCSAQHEWSGLVNTVTEDFDFLCSDDLAVTGVASTFRWAIPVNKLQISNSRWGAFLGRKKHFKIKMRAVNVPLKIILSGSSWACAGFRIFERNAGCAIRYFIALIFVYLLTVHQTMTEDGNIDVPVAEGLLTSRRNAHCRYSK